MVPYKTCARVENIAAKKQLMLSKVFFILNHFLDFNKMVFEFTVLDGKNVSRPKGDSPTALRYFRKITENFFWYYSKLRGIFPLPLLVVICCTISFVYLVQWLIYFLWNSVCTSVCGVSGTKYFSLQSFYLRLILWKNYCRQKMKYKTEGRNKRIFRRRRWTCCQ